ncbi:MAG: DUF1289 domain-containing protein [Pseudomonadota bacterium]
MANNSIESPCINSCCLNTNNICTGCYRSLEEIAQWRDASDSEKNAILDRAKERKQSLVTTKPQLR